MREARVAVIGAGVAGLSCASRLCGQNLSVRVFEKSRGLGGRLATRRGPRGEFDHGAQYFTVRDPDFESYLRSCEEVGRWTPRLFTLDSRKRRRKPLEQTFWVGIPRMNRLAHGLAQGQDIAVRSRITRFEWIEGNTTGWRLEVNGREHPRRFDWLVMAVPAPQAVEFSETRDLPFQAVLRKVEMAPCWALMVGFDEEWEADFDAAFVDDSPISWICRNSSKPGRKSGESWVIHAGAEWSRDHFELPPKEIESRLSSEFAQLFDHRIPPPAHGSAHRWRFARVLRPAGQPTLFAEEARIAFCGDWCLDGRVESAYLSGQAAAERILQQVVGHL